MLISYRVSLLSMDSIPSERIIKDTNYKYGHVNELIAFVIFRTYMVLGLVGADISSIGTILFCLVKFGMHNAFFSLSALSLLFMHIAVIKLIL